jgi:REP element-mobilizing transposase RayT
MAGNRHEMKILRVGTDVNHAHIFFQKLPKFSESKSINYLKGISSRIIRFNMPCLKLWCEDSFWSDGFWIQTVGYGWEAIDNYVKNQGIGV